MVWINQIKNMDSEHLTAKIDQIKEFWPDEYKRGYERYEKMREAKKGYYLELCPGKNIITEAVRLEYMCMVDEISTSIDKMFASVRGQETKKSVLVL